jgi:hypothetical protein
VQIPDARSSFPGLRDKTYLDAACVGLAPLQAARAIERFLERAVTCPDRDASTHHIALDAARGVAVREGARLLDADEDEIALVESTTHGLNLIAAAIPFTPDENVVICDLEFLQVAIPWLKLAERGAIREVRVARNRDGAVPVDVLAEEVDGRTRAVVVSSVQWTNGFAVDLHGIAELCRAHGALLVVDAIQQLGATRLSVADVPADVVVAGGHKWLNAPFGCGLLYVRRSALPGLRMPSWGYLGLDPPEGGWGRYCSGSGCGSSADRSPTPCRGSRRSRCPRHTARTRPSSVRCSTSVSSSRCATRPVSGASGSRRTSTTTMATSTGSSASRLGSSAAAAAAAAPPRAGPRSTASAAATAGAGFPVRRPERPHSTLDRRSRRTDRTPDTAPDRHARHGQMPSGAGLLLRSGYHGRRTNRRSIV